MMRPTPPTTWQCWGLLPRPGLLKLAEPGLMPCSDPKREQQLMSTPKTVHRSLKNSGLFCWLRKSLRKKHAVLGCNMHRSHL
eukprot:CAMPEP_0171090554 /NCGR_PEP_ID=MMETSP0766_2-20121228/31930_1 /TAXON_ID=439317 /ORGANISM="Gambierdiscus australes, Strain CAWD 149" /LENGTH=81 /DNA_ID=CAMNT_0011548557 /DNA_START=1 /DNA_END=243 /DNA_ORIENTATION=+